MPSDLKVALIFWILPVVVAFLVGLTKRRPILCAALPVMGFLFVTLMTLVDPLFVLAEIATLMWLSWVLCVISFLVPEKVQREIFIYRVPRSRSRSRRRSKERSIR